MPRCSFALVAGIVAALVLAILIPEAWLWASVISNRDGAGDEPQYVQFLPIICNGNGGWTIFLPVVTQPVWPPAPCPSRTPGPYATRTPPPSYLPTPTRTPPPSLLATPAKNSLGGLR